MKAKLVILLIGVGVALGLIGGTASAGPPFDGKCVGQSISIAAKSNKGAPDFDAAAFVEELKTLCPPS